LQWLFVATGLFALLAGWRQREPMYLLFGAAALAWVLRLLHYTWQPVPSAAGVAWADWLTVNSLVWVVALTFAFSARLVGLRPWRIERAVLLAAVLLALASLPGIGPLADYALAPWIYAVTGAASVGLLLVVGARARKQRDVATVFMAVALWTMFAFGIHDLLLMINWLPATSMFVMPFAALPSMASFAYAAAVRHARSVAEARRLNVELADRVQAAETRLRAAFDELAVIESKRVLAEERARLMRDMHDGLGGALMTSLAMVERGQMAPAQVAATLRECIEDLQLTIDSLEPAGDDLLALLGALRYRLGHRLEAAGLTIEWAVQPVPALPWLDPAAALHVLRIVQEVLTNTIKHAGATRVRVETATDGDAAVVRIADDGRGFDPAQAHAGRGLGNLRRRAAELGGSIDFASGAGGTTVTLLLPVARAPR
jgi:signal transduction histidine kinase